jgi:hypothetical protein
MVAVRAATLSDLPALTDIYNHYILHTPMQVLGRQLVSAREGPVIGCVDQLSTFGVTPRL